MILALVSLRELCASSVFSVTQMQLEWTPAVSAFRERGGERLLFIIRPEVST